MEFEAAAVKHWFDPNNGALKDTGKFGHLLTESFLYRRKWAPGGDDKAIQASRRALDRIEPIAQAEGGWYPERWERDKGREKPELIDQSSVARANWELALAR
jgi:hypothetical protein